MTEPDAIDKEIINAIAEENCVSPKTIGEEIGENRQRVYDRLQQLIINGRVEKIQRGVYQVVNDSS